MCYQCSIRGLISATVIEAPQEGEDFQIWFVLPSVWPCRWMWIVAIQQAPMWEHNPRCHYVLCKLGGFSPVVVIAVPFVPTVCPVGGGMWGVFRKPLKRAIWNTLGLHAVLTVCFRFSSFLDCVCATCCLFLSTSSCHGFIQIHTTWCCFPSFTTKASGAQKSALRGCKLGAGDPAS